MIAIYARRRSEWAECLRKELYGALIPCALIGPEYGSVRLAERLPFIVVDPDAGKMNDRLRQVIVPGKILAWTEDMLPAAALRQACLHRFGEDMEQFRRGGFRCMDGGLRFHGERIRLTPNERRILHLLLFCQGSYFTAEETAQLCLRSASGDAVAVHVCNMNSKAMRAASAPMIECRRYKGYRIPLDPVQE